MDFHSQPIRTENGGSERRILYNRQVVNAAPSERPSGDVARAVRNLDVAGVVSPESHYERILVAAIEAVIKLLTLGIRRPAERQFLPKACQEPLARRLSRLFRRMSRKLGLAFEELAMRSLCIEIAHRLFPRSGQIFAWHQPAARELKICKTARTGDISSCRSPD
jgi:hypothetical protein